MDVQELAATAAKCFEVAKRPSDDGEDLYFRVKDGSPEWVTEVVHQAHGDMLPDDWRYECIATALDAISEGTEDADFADAQVDVYTDDLLEWLGSHSDRRGYCDQANEEGLIEPRADIDTRIRAGQYLEAQEIYGLVLAALESLLA